MGTYDIFVYNSKAHGVPPEAVNVPSERRYQVRLDTNDVIAIKQRNVAPEHGDAPKDSSSEAAKKKKSKGGSKADEDALSELMTKLMQDIPEADPGKLGEFAAGYLLAKQKLNTDS